MILEKTDNYSHPDDIKRHIFILDDDPHIVELTRTFLYYKGFQVTTAFTAQEGFDLIRKERPDLILLDIMLPDMNGLVILKKIKEDQRIANIQILILTNLGQDNIIEEGFKLGAVGYIIKAAYTPDEIVQKVKNILKD